MTPEREIKDTYNRDYTQFEKDWIDFINLIQTIVKKWNAKLAKDGGYVMSSSQLCPQQGIFTMTVVNKTQINTDESREKK